MSLAKPMFIVNSIHLDDFRIAGFGGSFQTDCITLLDMGGAKSMKGTKGPAGKMPAAR
jgi:hypothetical protein